MAEFFNALGIVAAFIASAFWFTSATVKLPDGAFGTKWDDDGSAEKEWAEKTTKWNRLAAAASGISALLFGLAAIAG